MLWSANMDAPGVQTRAAALRVAAAFARPDESSAPDAARWQTSASSVPRRALTAVVLTAVDAEYNAVLEQLTDRRFGRLPSGSRWRRGTVRGEYADWTVYLLQTKRGNVPAASLTTDAAGNLLPDVLLFVGVGRGLKLADQRIADIVVAEFVDSYELGKDTVASYGAAKFVPGGDPATAPHLLVELAKEQARTWNHERPDGPSVSFGQIVSGEKVAAGPARSQLEKLLASHFGRALALDMESYGFSKAAETGGFAALVVRSISDFGLGKNAVDDSERQPLAARSAACFAMELLRRAEPSDIPPSHRTRPPQPAPTIQGVPAGAPDSAASAAALTRLAPSVHPYLTRLQRLEPARAASALSDLAARAQAPAGWLGRSRHRPPQWLREDETGEAWAVFARFADSHGSAQAIPAYERAARARAAAGDDVSAAIYGIYGALSFARCGTDERGAALDEPARRSGAIHRLKEQSGAVAAPIVAFLAAAIDFGVDRADAVALERAQAVAPAALFALGVDFDPVPGTETASVEPESEAAASRAGFEELGESDPQILAMLRAEILVVFGALQERCGDTNSALRAAEAACTYSPGMSSPLILKARVLLQRQSDPAATSTARRDALGAWAEVESLALRARDMRRPWFGPAGEALAIAGQARLLAGDAYGALRLVLPAPDGQATETEAADSGVLVIASRAAGTAGDGPLAARLADGVSDPVERELLRAFALSLAPGSEAEVENCLVAALRESGQYRIDQVLQAVLALAPLKPWKDPATEPAFMEGLRRVREASPESADMVEATLELHAGRPLAALARARQYRNSYPAIYLAVQAAEAAGRTDEAIDLLDKAGRRLADQFLRVQAMALALRTDKLQTAESIAAELVGDPNDEIRRRALEIRMHIANISGQWSTAEALARQLTEERDFDQSDALREQHVIEYRWLRALALYNLRETAPAFAVLQQPDPLPARTRGQAVLLLTLLHAEGNLPTSLLSPPALVERALAVAQDWPEDEEILGSVLSLASLASADTELPDEVAQRLQSLSESFFTRFDSPQWQRIDPGENLEGLIEYMRERMAPGSQALAQILPMVWLGLYPHAVMTATARRSYAESLIKNNLGLGCYVIATPDPALMTLERESAAGALEHGGVVLDTSALYMLEHLALPAVKIMAWFARALMPATQRDDILNARSGLALRSTGTLGWDPYTNRPFFSEIPQDVVEKWAGQARRLAERLELVEPVQASEATTEVDRDWSAAVRTAKEHGLALWADDFALRQVARAEGVAAFGTLDLLGLQSQQGVISRTDYLRALDDLVEARAVDLPILERLRAICAKEQWQPDGYGALMLSRPSTWAPPPQGWERYMSLVRVLPLDVARETIATWAQAAATGLAWATPPIERAHAVGALLVWTAVTKNDPQLIPLLLDAGERVGRVAMPDADVLARFVEVLADIVRQAAGAEQSGAIVTRLLQPLDDERRERAMRVFLGSR